MDGPSHYVEGEKSFAKAKWAAKEMDGASAVLYMQAAQYHAIMAAAAAIAGNGDPRWLNAYGALEEGEIPQ